MEINIENEMKTKARRGNTEWGFNSISYELTLLNDYPTKIQFRTNNQQIRKE